MTETRERVRDRIALITGAGGPAIGSAIVRRFANMGSALVLIDSDQQRCDAITAEVKGNFDVPVLAFCLDVTDRPAVDEAVQAASDEFGSMDVLVNNAGITAQGSTIDFDVSLFDRILAVNAIAPWYIMRAVLPGMRELGRGSIVNLSSVAAYLGGKGREAAYSASKAALNDLTRSVAIDVGKFGIRCNGIAPALTRSPLQESRSDVFNSYLKDIPLGRFAEPEEIASVAGFLCSDDAKYITGEVVTVSGGWYVHP